jgi:hypothetical protein
MWFRLQLRQDGPDMRSDLISGVLFPCHASLLNQVFGIDWGIG